MKIRICKLLVAFVSMGLASPTISHAADLVSQHHGAREWRAQAGSYPRGPAAEPYYRECSVLNVKEPGSNRDTTVCHPVVQLSPLMRARPGGGSNGAEFSTGASFRAQ